MEEITQAAKAAYENFSDEDKRDMEDFFNSMDRNGDGKISLQEFMAFSREEGCNPMVKRSMFNLVDQNGHGSLQMEEVLTLCYIIASGRPNCDGCGVFISGLFFTCTHCRLNNEAQNRESYDLCIPCYHGKEFVHEHTEFVDNYMLLLKMQEMLSSGDLQDRTETMSSGSLKAEEEEPNMINSSQFLKANGSQSRSREKMKKAFRIFAAVLSVATNAQTLSSMTL